MWNSQAVKKSKLLKPEGWNFMGTFSENFYIIFSCQYFQYFTKPNKFTFVSFGYSEQA